MKIRTAQARTALSLAVVLGALVLGALILGFGCARERAPVVATPLDPEAEEALFDTATRFFQPLPAQATNPDNPATPARVDLGKTLFFDTRLSREGNVSCNSCHSLATFGVDNLPFSPGDEGELGGRNSPTVLNAALHVAQFWDGRARDVEEQAGMPILNPVEMAIPSEEFLVARLSQVGDYPRRFAEAFPGDDEPLSYDNIGRALAAFERTLLTPSRFDAYLEGDRDALTPLEKRGLQHFVELSCTSCHNGVNVGAASFRRFGLQAGYWEHTGSEKIDEGRYAQTGDRMDKYVFKVASLRNVEKTAPYFHDGSVATLEEAVAVMGRAQLGQSLEPETVASLTAFLRSLTGELPPEVMASLEP